MSRLISVIALLALGAPQAPAPLRVKASPAVAPCVAAAARAYERASGRRLAVETRDLEMPESATGADLVVAADQELQRILESGTSDPRLELDVARIPWVWAGAPGAGALDPQSLAAQRGAVQLMGGIVARELRYTLEKRGRMPARVERLRDVRAPLQLAGGETAIVPLSLAGPGPVASLDVPPLWVRAVGVRASTRSSEVRAFLDFLAGEPGNAAFRACGRADAP